MRYHLKDETTQRSSRKPLEDYLTILAVVVGFEPTDDSSPSTVFKTVTFDLSVTLPCRLVLTSVRLRTSYFILMNGL